MACWFSGCASVSAVPFQGALHTDHASAVLAGTPEDFKKTCDRELAAAKDLVADVRAATTPLAVLAKYDDATNRLNNMSYRASLAEEVHPNAAMREAAETCEQQLEAYGTEISQDRAVYDAINTIDVATLEPLTAFWVSKVLRDFRRSGVDRDEATRKEIAILSDDIVKISQVFARNIRDDVRTAKFTPAELEGAPADWFAAHPVVDGLISVTTDSPDAVPVMTYVKSAKTRRTLWHLNKNRGFPSNVEVLNSLIAARYELAQKLGAPNWAAFETEIKMAKTPEAVAQFIAKARVATDKRATADMQTLLTRKRKDEPTAERVESWDAFFYVDRVQSEQFNLDSQLLRQYFEYDHVRAGVMEITAALFGIRYQPVTDAKVWHPEVETFDLFDGQQLLGRIHLDMHPREGKYKHAAQFTLTPGGGTSLPEAALVCNFARPGGLMQHSEVETFFHEFGHMLHTVFAARQQLHGLAGLTMERDFVEAPSMLLQEWPLRAEVLQRFAKHAQTNEPIPASLVAQLVAAKQFGIGLYTRRQLSLAALSLELHRRAPGFDTHDVVGEVEKPFEPIFREWAPDTHFELAFGHLGSYGAAYYTYVWSTVIAKDLLTRFQATSMMDASVAREYREKVLGRGGARPAAESVADFLGRPTNFDAFERWLNETPAPAK